MSSVASHGAMYLYFLSCRLFAPAGPNCSSKSPRTVSPPPPRHTTARIHLRSTCTRVAILQTPKYTKPLLDFRSEDATTYAVRLGGFLTFSLRAVATTGAIYLRSDALLPLGLWCISPQWRIHGFLRLTRVHGPFRISSREGFLLKAECGRRE